MDRVQYRIELLPDVFCEKTQNEIAGPLEQLILPAIAAIGFGVVEVLGAFQQDRRSAATICLIATIACATCATIVAAATDEFQRIHSLKVENWLA